MSHRFEVTAIVERFFSNLPELSLDARLNGRPGYPVSRFQALRRRRAQMQRLRYLREREFTIGAAACEPGITNPARTKHAA